MPAITSLILGGIALGGIGMSAYGMSKQQDALAQQKQAQTIAAGEMTAAQTAEIKNEQQIQASQKQQMDLDYKRSQVQILRNWQTSRSMSVATATNQGAGGVNPSSALSGALAGENAAAGTQTRNNAQNYSIGNDIYAYNQQISKNKIDYAAAQTSYGLAGAVGAANAGAAQGLMSLGGAITSGASMFSNVLSSAGGVAKAGIGNAFSFGTGPGSWSGGALK